MDDCRISGVRGLSVAPMMDWTDRHCRYFLRQISRHVTLYTEMLTAGAVIHGDRSRLLGFHPAEQPLVLQLGGSDPNAMGEAAAIAAEFGYRAVNVNVGCPSDRVQTGRFGACLMAEPDLVAKIVLAMRRASGLPISVKCRIGIDDQDIETALDRFVDTVAEAEPEGFIIHARKAWLKGLSPKENREVPPLDHDRVHRLKARRPELLIAINGGIADLSVAEAHCKTLDGAMLGRAAYHNPFLFAEADQSFFGEAGVPVSRWQVVQRMLPYIEAAMDVGVPLHAITRHMLGLFQGVPGARLWRRILSEGAHKPGADGRLVAQAAEAAEEAMARLQAA